MDPASFDQHQLGAVLSTGVNRISLGGQSFDDDVLAELGRRHRRTDLVEACLWLAEAQRSGDLRSWSLDLIQNLPGQTLEGWDHQLDQAIASGAPHLSVYDLSVEPGTVFARRAQRDQLELPDDDLAASMLSHTSLRLAQAGLSRYEISNHAQPGHASRHNRVYWSGAGWWGFGMGATSAPWGERLARPRTRDGYRRWVEAPRSAESGQGIALDDRLLVGLRRREGVDLRGLPTAGLEQRWQPFLDQGLLQRLAGRWRLTDPQGMALSNRVLVEVVMWWESELGSSSAEHQQTASGLESAPD